MKHEYYQPSELVTDYVRTILVIDGSQDGADHQYPIFTNGMPTLFSKTKREENGLRNVSQLALFSMTAPSDYWTVDQSTAVIAYFFKPFALTTLFNVDAKTLSKNSIDLNTWSAHKCNALKTQLMYADTIAKQMEIVDNLLQQQRSENKEMCDIVDYATEAMMLNPSNEILTDILARLSLNERTFQRIFKKYVGVTPTQFRRISQFQLSFDHLRSKQFEKMSDVAFDNGFADQSHFIRAFKEFTHITPNDYLQHGLKPKK